MNAMNKINSLSFKDCLKSEIELSIEEKNENFIVCGRTKDNAMKDFFHFNYMITKQEIKAFIFEMESLLSGEKPNKELIEIDGSICPNKYCQEVTLVGRNSEDILLGGVIIMFLDLDYFKNNEYFMIIQFFDGIISTDTYILRNEAVDLLNYVKSFYNKNLLY